MKVLCLLLAFCLCLSSGVAFGASATEDFAGTGALSASWTTVTGLDPPVRAAGIGTPSTADVDNAAYYNALTPANDQWAQLTWVINFNNYAILLLRQATGAETSYQCSAGVGDATWYIQEDTSGSKDTLASGGLTSNEGDIFYCDVVGSDITFKQNGGTLGTISDATITSGRVGFGLWVESGHGGFEVQIDDWSGGDFEAAPPASPPTRGGARILQ